MTEVAVLLCITGAFQSFDLFYVMTNGGPDHATEIVTTYLVSIVFRDHEVGYGAALSRDHDDRRRGHRSDLRQVADGEGMSTLSTETTRPSAPGRAARPSAGAPVDALALERHVLHRHDCRSRWSICAAGLDGAVLVQGSAGDLRLALVTPDTRSTSPSSAERGRRGGLGTYVINSIIVTTVSVFAILLFGAMAAFALSRLKFRLRGFFLVFLALGLLLPGPVVLHRPKHAARQAAHHRHPLGADHPLHRSRALARGLPAQGLPRLASPRDVRVRPDGRLRRRAHVLRHRASPHQTRDSPPWPCSRS